MHNHHAGDGVDEDVLAADAPEERPAASRLRNPDMQPIVRSPFGLRLVGPQHDHLVDPGRGYELPACRLAPVQHQLPQPAVVAQARGELALNTLLAVEVLDPEAAALGSNAGPDFVLQVSGVAHAG